MSRRVFVTVNRGMTDSTSVCVFPWEVDILKLVHGDGVEEVTIDKMCEIKGAVRVEKLKQKHSNVAPPSLREQLEAMTYVDPEQDPANDPAAEFERLAVKYGMDKEMPMSCVERVYGQFTSGAFESKLKQFAKDRAPAPAVQGAEDGEELASLTREELREACRERGIPFKATESAEALRAKLGMKQAA